MGHASVISYFGLKESLALLGALSLIGCATTGEVAETSYSLNDPNVTCKPKYTQVYQPPLKLGGSGRVIQIPSGQTCEPIARKETKAEAAAYIRQAKFTSLPNGAIIVVHKQDKDFTPLGGCTTPCTMDLDYRGRYIGIAQMSGAQETKGEFIPVAFPPKDEQGVAVHFTRTSPSSVTLSALSAPDFSVAAGNAVKDKEAKALVQIAGFMPKGVTKSGHCQMRFDVTQQGIPTNMQAASCTDNIFRAPSLTALAKWSYNPRLKDGNPVGIIGVETKMSYKLVGSNGKVMAE